jgi:two-component system, LuxR family, response regulator FixJ
LLPSPGDERNGEVIRKPTVFVVDDDEAVLHSITWMLRKEGLTVEAFDSPRAILEVYDCSRPGCLVLDLRLPGMNGLELHRKLAERGCRHPFIMVTGHGEVPDAVEAMHEGAIDFIEKPYSRQQLLNRIQQALRRDAVDRKLETERQRLRRRLATLTRRERQVLSMAVAGKMTKAIARSLRLSPKTVEVYRSNVARKAQVETLSELIVGMVRLQIEPPKPRRPTPKAKRSRRR